MASGNPIVPRCLCLTCKCHARFPPVYHPQQTKCIYTYLYTLERNFVRITKFMYTNRTNLKILPSLTACRHGNKKFRAPRRKNGIFYTGGELHRPGEERVWRERMRFIVALNAKKRRLKSEREMGKVSCEWEREYMRTDTVRH